jgi:hypothetical protein
MNEPANATGIPKLTQNARLGLRNRDSINITRINPIIALDDKIERLSFTR